MAAQANSYITSATINGNQLTFQVKVNDFESNDVIEITGQATQSGGAFAPISSIKTVPAKSNGDNYVEVTAGKMGEYPFRKDQDVTVFVRVSRVWVTVLGPQGKSAGTRAAGQEAEDQEAEDQKADDGMIWDDVRKVSEMEDNNSPGHGGWGHQPTAGQPSAP
jgi:branched-subunit amino acid aminotransferase/4-amino-4-deoxychorismate lyase